MASTKKNNSKPKETKKEKKCKDTIKSVIVSQSPQNDPTGVTPDNDDSRVVFENELKKIQSLGFIKDSRGMGIIVPDSASIDNDEEEGVPDNLTPEDPKENISLFDMELAKTLDNITNEDVILLNKEGKSLYECIGITPEETDELMVSVKTIMRQSIRKAEKVEELANNCLKNHKLLCLLLWLEEK